MASGHPLQVKPPFSTIPSTLKKIFSTSTIDSSRILGFEPNLGYLIYDLGLAYFLGIEKDFSFSFQKANARLLHTVKPIQGFFNHKRSCRSGHAIDLENDFICDSEAGGGNYRTGLRVVASLVAGTLDAASPLVPFDHTALMGADGREGL